MYFKQGEKMKKSILMSMLLVLCSVAHADGCKLTGKSEYLQAVFVSSATAKFIRAKVGPSTSYLPNTVGREVCYLDGQLSSELDRLGQMVDEMGPANRGHFIESVSQQAFLGMYCHSNIVQGVQNLSPKEIYNSVDKIISELDAALITP
jgi:hypothetical protein